MNMSRGKAKMWISFLIAVTLIVSVVALPLQNIFAINTASAITLNRGDYISFPQTVENYATSGKTLEFDLNTEITSDDVVKFRLYDIENNPSSSSFRLENGMDGLRMTMESVGDGWFHYTLAFATIPYSEEQDGASASKMRLMTTPSDGLQIANVAIGVDITSLPEAFTDDYDIVTLESLGLTGTDYQTTFNNDTYTFEAKSATHSEIIKLGWKPTINDKYDWKLALDTYWNSACMVWFRPDHIFFCPGWSGGFQDLFFALDPIVDGTHNLEFGRLRVVAGPNYGKDYVFLKIDGATVASGYTDYYQTSGGYVAHNGGEITSPNNKVCFVDEGVSQQRFSGFGKPDQFVSDIDVINIADIIAPETVVKDTKTDTAFGRLYPYTPKSETKSTIAKFVLKTGNNINDVMDGSFMVVDIGGNCGFCRSYIAAGSHQNVMFAWEFEECTSGTKKYNFESNTWYGFEQGRKRVVSGKHKGDDYVYLKIDGELISGFYVKAESRPQAGNNFYIEAFQNFEIYGYHELSAKFYVDGELYKDQFSQKGFTVKKPEDPTKSGQYFVGWYTAENGGKLFDFKNTKLTDNIKLYARFTTSTVKATFNPNNGSAASVLTVGKNCLIPQPANPTYSDGKYEYAFTGWKNNTTGKIFNFETDTISADTTFTAQYKEKEYYVSYYSFGKLVDKVPFVLSNPSVKGKEPKVPTIANMTGAWESHKNEGLTGNMTVNAVYNGTTPTASTAIKLSGYNGGNIYLNSSKIHDYLTTEGAVDQTSYVRNFSITTPTDFQDHQNTAFKWTDSGKNNSYTLYFADNKNFKNAYIVTTTQKSMVNKVGIFVPGKTYYWYVRGNNTGKCSAVDTFKVINTPVRYITAGAVTNMRDEGGYMTTDGYKVKYGMVYRGASLDEFHSHVDDTARGVFNYLGMKSEIELRGGMDHDYTGWDENNPNVFYISASAYEPVLTIGDKAQIAQYKATFDAMANPDNYPFYFHCSAGADRTGAFGYLLNGLLGVPYADLRKDYELTSFSEVGLRPADGFSDGSFDHLNRLMLENYGDGSGNLAKAIENFLKSHIGVSQETIDSIRNIMLDKTPTPNTKPYTVTVDVLGKKETYKAYDGIYFMPKSPSASGKIFLGFYNGKTKYTGYAKSNLNLTAKFETIEYEPYDTISMKDLGVEKTIWNQTNTVYTYKKSAKTGGRVFQFILIPTENMNDGAQIALTNDWNVNSYARAWFQTNTMSYFYYNGKLDSGPDISKTVELKAGKEYKIQFSVRVMKNKAYQGVKVFEVTINGETVMQYIGCKADLSENMIYFHGATGKAKIKNWPVYKTVKLYNGSTLYKTCKVERCDILPKITVPGPKNGVPFAGWYTAKSGGKLWDENTEPVYDNMSLYARFAHVKVVTAVIDGKKLTYRILAGGTLDSIPAPKKAGNVFTGWLVNGKPFTGKVTSNMTVTAGFEPYSYDEYDEISLRDIGIYKDQYFGPALDVNNTANFTYYKSAATGGRVFKAIYVPSANMSNGPQVSFSPNWTENYLAKLYFTKEDTVSVYGNSEMDGTPAKKMEMPLIGGKEYLFEIGVRVLNNKGYKGVKVFTVYINGELIFEQFNNRAPLEGCDVFLQGMPDTGYFRNVNIYKTVSFYNGNKLLATKKVLRGERVKSYGNLSDQGDRLFKGWLTDYGTNWNFEIDSVYNDTTLRAEFEKKTYPVLLMVDDVLYQRLNIGVGESVDVYDMPVKDGFVFDKWLDENGNEYDLTKPVNAPVTLVASFKAAAPADDKLNKLEEKVTPIETKKKDSKDLLYILFGVIGLVVIALETGFLIYKKRNKRS